MTPTIVSILCGSGAGGVTGSLAGWLVSRRAKTSTDGGRRRIVIDPDTSARIDEAARHWANDNGIPEGSGLVARKLRLALALQERRRGRSA
jgi:hypothetical protein